MEINAKCCLVLCLTVMYASREELSSAAARSEKSVLPPPPMFFNGYPGTGSLPGHRPRLGEYVPPRSYANGAGLSFGAGLSLGQGCRWGRVVLGAGLS